MRRTGDWGRKKRLTAKTPMPRTGLARRGALVSNAERTRAAAAKPRKPLVSRPKAVTPEERRARTTVKARSGGRCEACSRAPGQEMHHRVNRSQGGAWAAENLIHLCSPHHQHVTVNPALAVERGWSVRSTQNPAETPVWLAGRGWSYLASDGSITPAEKRDAA